MSANEEICALALGFVKGMTADFVRRMRQRRLELKEYFTLPAHELMALLEVNERAPLRGDIRDEALRRAVEEMAFIERNHIRVLSLYLDNGYPFLLSQCADAPINLFVLGEADLDADKILAMVGTRRATAMGTGFCRRLLADLKELGVYPTVVSGLAYGIDAASHEAAMEQGLPTVAVVAHGLDTIYPADHRDMGRRILHQGGAIVTEYPSHTRPYAQNFLKRNRIIAGLSHAVMVVESAIRGGALSTASVALSYSRDVCALPGRYADPMSEGCNFLIRKMKATLVSSAADLIEVTRWAPEGKVVTEKSRNLFPDLLGEEKEIYTCLRDSGRQLTVGDLHEMLGIPVAVLIQQLAALDFQGVVEKLPGNRYIATT